MNVGFAVVIMVVMAAIGFFTGAMGNDAFGGAILFALISGMACVIHAINRKKETED